MNNLNYMMVHNQYQTSMTSFNICSKNMAVKLMKITPITICADKTENKIKQEMKTINSKNTKKVSINNGQDFSKFEIVDIILILCNVAKNPYQRLEN